MTLGVFALVFSVALLKTRSLVLANYIASLYEVTFKPLQMTYKRWLFANNS